MSDELPLKTLLKNMFKEMSLDHRFNETQVFGIWNRTVGEMVSSHTQNIRIQNGILYVSIDSAVLRNELHYSKTKLIRLLNQKLNKNTIKDIVFH